MSSYAEVMDPGDGEGIHKTVEQAVLELVEAGPSQPITETKYIARLFCGHEVAGVTRAEKIRFGTHGAWCPDCDAFSLFVDVVLARDLVS